MDSGKFYPPAVKTPEDRLRYYASLYPFVEVDSSYYAIPAPQSAAHWAERTPPEFRFNVKAFRIFTGHQTAPKVLPKDIREALPDPKARNVYWKELPGELREALWKRFREAVEPLRAAGKLRALHFQFAPWMTFRPDSLDHIRECRAALADYTLAVEFRHRSWFDEKHRERTLDFERDLELANVIVDEPQGFANSIPTVLEVTHPQLALVRLHGRNHETWNIKGATTSAERFNYDYSEPELVDLAAVIEKLEAPEVHVVFNNNYEDQGQRNARTLAAIFEANADGNARPRENLDWCG